jgi:hypothetical protein
VVFWTWVGDDDVVVGTIERFFCLTRFSGFSGRFSAGVQSHGHHLGDRRHGARMVSRFHIVQRITHF